MTLAVMIALPTSGTAQALGAGVRAGTLGMGGEVALGLGERVVVRAGAGYMPMSPATTIDEIPFTLTLPSAWYTAGMDIYLAGTLRIGGGMLVRRGGFSLEADLSSAAGTTLGSQVYTDLEVFALTAELDTPERAPYVVLGFGNHTSGRPGLFLDLGVVMSDQPNVNLSVQGDPVVVGSAAFLADLAAQEDALSAQAPTYLRFWPVVSLGFRIGTGR
ncbi:MAG: hypothetical protein OEZ65_09480 [Gemmatimonadota bacterium]|nr:hypothetical protein [Gemmatimonadota bacterium]MDH5759806.1 hypothetical protein [Gemmatimonadota bacterium]